MYVAYVYYKYILTFSDGHLNTVVVTIVGQHTGTYLLEMIEVIPKRPYQITVLEIKGS